MPLYAAGLWDAVTISPACRPRAFTAAETAGVGTTVAETNALKPWRASSSARSRADSRPRARVS